MENYRILAFLNIWATKCREDDDIAYIELMMDDHKCVEFENQS